MKSMLQVLVRRRAGKKVKHYFVTPLNVVMIAHTLKHIKRLEVPTADDVYKEQLKTFKQLKLNK